MFKYLRLNLKVLKIIGIIFLIVLTVFLILGGIVFSYEKSYNDRVYKGVYIGNYHLGGMKKTEIINFVEAFNNRLVSEGIRFYYIDENNKKNIFKIDTFTKGEDNSIELVKLNSQSLAQQAIQIGRSNSWFNNFFNPAFILFKKENIQAKVDLKDELFTYLKNDLKSYSKEVTDANIKIKTLNPLTYDIISEQQGMYFDYSIIKNDLVKNLSILKLDDLQVKRNFFEPTIKVAQVKQIANSLSVFLSYGNFGLNHVDSKTKLKKDWILKPSDYQSWIKVIKDDEGNLIFALNKKEVETYLKTIKGDVEQEAVNAKFEIATGKVQKFQASQSGIKIDTDKVFLDLDKAFRERNYQTKELTKTVSLAVEIVEPEIKMADANNLGISDVLGVGISSYKYSHVNRIKNIANAVNKLNGVIIKPGEIFSTNKYAGPYTAENGYYPEEVIIGDQIKIEIGGGMCQIGTTMFRSAMNSAMPITQRVNHSLVVRYYEDPVNHNPGTDATLYDPYLDLKFENDTGNYMLLQTEMIEATLDLKFTLWGKSDGRKGSYTHPEVLQWYYPGATIERKTTTLQPGQKSCQNAFTGAKATFTYTRITSSSEKIDRVFDSYYRPLSQICMVGVSLGDFCKDNVGSTECKDYKESSASTTPTSE